MFDPRSRYASLNTKTLTVTDRDGTTRDLRYVERRFLPSISEATTPLAEHTVMQGERLDQITARYLGDPQQFWRVADANNTFAPEDLTAEPGKRITIPLPNR